MIHHFYAWYGLTQANYVEHYGLLRQKLPNGRYELPEPRHSWNTNHIYSNLISFHLQRHSDHHANALRPYQALRDFDGPAAPAERLSGQLRPRDDSAAVVQGDGSEADGNGRAATSRKVNVDPAEARAAVREVRRRLGSPQAADSRRSRASARHACAVGILRRCQQRADRATLAHRYASTSEVRE